MVVQLCKQGSACCPRVLKERSSIDLFKALGDPSRLTILASLLEAQEPLRVTEIGTCCPQDISVVSRHLTVLRQAGVVQAERRGREVRYSVSTDKLVGFLRELADVLEACCGAGAKRNE